MFVRWPRNLYACLVLMGCLAGQRPTGRIEGCVVDVLGERLPLADITVVAGVETVGVTRCDALGCFVLSKVPLDTLTVVARAADHHAGFEPVELDTQQTEARIRVRLLDAAPVTGRVRGADGKGLSGALIVLGPWSRMNDPVFTDAAGCYCLPAVPLGRASLTVLATGHDAQHEVLQVTGASTHDIQLWAGPVADYRLTVRNASAGHWAQLRCSFRSLGPFGDVLEDVASAWPHRRQDDTMVYAGLPANLEIQDIAIITGGAVLHWTVDAVAGQHCRMGELQERVTVPIVVRGTVRDPSGKPLAGRRIAPRDHVATKTFTSTDDAGRFSLVIPVGQECFAFYLDEDEYALHCGDDTSGGAVYFGDPAATGVHDVVADRAASVSGKLLDAEGTPVFGADVQLEREVYGCGPDSRVASSRTGRDGSFRLRRLDAHPGFLAWLRLTATEGLHVEGPMHLSPGRDLDLGTIRLPRPAVIEGSAIGSDGRPILGQTVWLVRNPPLPHTEAFWTACTDRRGRFRFAGLPAGSYAVKTIAPMRWVEWPDYGTATVTAGERAVIGR
jgi:Carboxypeptidase regulatory-like domain